MLRVPRAQSIAPSSVSLSSSLSADIDLGLPLEQLVPLLDYEVNLLSVAIRSKTTSRESLRRLRSCYDNDPGDWTRFVPTTSGHKSRLDLMASAERCTGVCIWQVITPYPSIQSALRDLDDEEGETRCYSAVAIMRWIRDQAIAGGMLEKRICQKLLEVCLRFVLDDRITVGLVDRFGDSQLGVFAQSSIPRVPALGLAFLQVDLRFTRHPLPYLRTQFHDRTLKEAGLSDWSLVKSAAVAGGLAVLLGPGRLINHESSAAFHYQTSDDSLDVQVLEVTMELSYPALKNGDEVLLDYGAAYTFDEHSQCTRLS